MKKKNNIQAQQVVTPAEICQKRQEKIFRRHSVENLIKKIVIIAGIVTVVLYFVFGIAIVQDQTMYPSMRDGDIAFYYRLNRSYQIGDIVTFRREGIRYYGRIVAQSGDQVDMSEEGDLLINGNVQSEDILYPTYKTESTTTFPFVVEEGEYFVLGDMRTSAIDSRDYGAVKQSEINGTVFSVIKRRGI